jgi:hypothetical protein
MLLCYNVRSLTFNLPTAAVIAVLAAAPGSMSLDLSGPNFEVSPLPSSDPDSYLVQSSILKSSVPSPVE